MQPSCSRSSFASYGVDRKPLEPAALNFHRVGAQLLGAGQKRQVDEFEPVAPDEGVEREEHGQPSPRSRAASSRLIMVGDVSAPVCGQSANISA